MDNTVRPLNGGGLNSSMNPSESGPFLKACQTSAMTPPVTTTRLRPVKWWDKRHACLCCSGSGLQDVAGRYGLGVEILDEGEVATTFGPFVALLGQNCAHQTSSRGPVGEDAHHIGAPADLPVQSLQRVVGPELLPVGHWEASEGQDVGKGICQHLGSLGEVLSELGYHPVGLGVDLLR